MLIRTRRALTGSRRGFTLLELLVALVILGILATMAFAGQRIFQAKAKDSAARTQLEAYARSVAALTVSDQAGQVKRTHLQTQIADLPNTVSSVPANWNQCLNSDGSTTTAAGSDISSPWALCGVLGIPNGPSQYAAAFDNNTVATGDDNAVAGTRAVITTTSLTGQMYAAVVTAGSPVPQIFCLTTAVGPADAMADPSKLGSCGTTTTAPVVIVPKPSNDDFANAIATTASTAYDTNGATLETGEPVPASSTRTVWYTYTATATGTFAVTPAPGARATVYTGASAASLTVAGGSCATGPAVFSTTAGSTYKIRIHDTGAAAAGSFTIAAATSNDNFVNAWCIPALSGTDVYGPITFDTSGKSGETNEPTPDGTDKSAWWVYTPSTNQGLRIEHNLGAFNVKSTVLYTGTAVGSLTEVPFLWDNGDEGHFSLKGGTTYYIRLANGSFPRVGHQFRVTPLPMANDAFTDATVIASLPGGSSSPTYAYDTSYAYSETFEASTVNNPQYSVWYRYTPAADQGLRINRAPYPGAGQYYDLFTGPDQNNLTPYANPWANGDDMRFSLKGGTTYWLRVGDRNWPGAGSFTMTAWAQPNDAFATATAIPALASNGAASTAYPFDTRYATVETNEPNAAGVARTVWYSYTPGRNHNLTLTRTGLGIGSGLEVYTGTWGSLGAPSINSMGSGVYTMSVTAGTTYWIRVQDPNAPQAGTLTLTATS